MAPEYNNCLLWKYSVSWTCTATSYSHTHIALHRIRLTKATSSKSREDRTVSGFGHQALLANLALEYLYHSCPFLDLELELRVLIPQFGIRGLQGSFLGLERCKAFSEASTTLPLLDLSQLCFQCLYLPALMTSRRKPSVE